ncbi:glucose inhibited division protein A [Paludibacter propionicigenes WB4]|uniref:tRNA uridine 5-carboxymethylaminomethyl modification enzyme MnmG n=1 Tax=Paludibacter propionicigenes (strain DSM 17365 / JCM 13257 / WB4) TaxID=694427 RepID=E4T683_PALPW|nr:tRNA uridine-5-carboxymethylaminomethyl(34) synthesis enzyme MnmG [Paludibacter propionicigenes]ADQ80227.1 glucose inhibited division protein A [Paludibacter propionicigenes WB4]
MDFKYDVIVIGAGHAGNEAACAAANMGSKTLLITMDMNKIGQMSCNPAVGGIAKGQIVREIDALGGQMGIITDRSAIQFRMLNRSKGPAMWSPRSQSDRHQFIQHWISTITNIPNLYVWQDTVKELVIENGEVTGLISALGVHFRAKSVVLTAGTFLGGLMHFGKNQLVGGRISEPASFGITEQLKSIGFTTDRMKTGTPCRIDGRSIDFSKMSEQKGENDFHKFSFLEEAKRELKQESCWITNTNQTTHDELRKGLADSPLFNGQIQSIGPRYCPSIETKIVTFADKISHQLFLEPEGVDSQEYYLNGFSSSLPLRVQIDAIHTIQGLENAQLFRPGYAIEYDFFDPTQLKHTLETKRIKNLFFAGQVNGTTGYEEAGGQGLIAGINAHINCMGGKEFTLARNEAYIGVLIDDLVTKGVDEPYRMFTSRAEYRLILRQDDADVRLTGKGYEIGLATNNRFQQLNTKIEKQNILTEFIKNYSIKPAFINEFLASRNSSELKHGCKLSDLVLRPQLSIEDLSEAIPALKEKIEAIGSRKEEIVEATEVLLKYEGYIEREKLIADKLQRLEHINIRGRIDYNTIQSLSTEARQKLSKIDPETIGQASRIPGISPSDVNILLVLLGR